MLQFDTALAATSNPFSVNDNRFLSRNREMPGDRREARYGKHDDRVSGAWARAVPWGRY
jgi:hypothetical protein